MPQGGRIRVSIASVEPGRRIDEPGLAGVRLVSIRVTDQGKGIPEALLHRVTEPFFTTKEAGKGTGLGLSMVAGFVQQSGGKIRIDSKKGQGTTIELLFPCTDEAAKAVLAEPQRTSSSIGEARAVLLVDDDEIVRTVLGEQLRELGFKVDEAPDGQSAIDCIERNGAYDVLLSDFAMPGMNGIDTIQAALRARPSLRALLMTGYADGEAVGDLRHSVPIIRKPVDINDLAGRLSAAD